jgi:hypothetical protein
MVAKKSEGSQVKESTEQPSTAAEEDGAKGEKLPLPCGVGQ